MDHKSTWRQFEKSRTYPTLSGAPEADVLIIGGGLTAILAAYLLKDSGLSIVVAEAETLGYRASGSTTGFLMEVIDTDAQELIAAHGEHTAKQILDSHRDAIRLYEETSKRESIECDFMRTPLYAYARDAAGADQLQKEVLALNTLGRSARWMKDAAIHMPNKGYLQLNDQAKFHPLKFLYGLAEIVERSGVKIYEHSKIELGSVQAKWILAATHYPPEPQPKSIYFKKAQYLTYVIEAQLPRGTLPEGLYEDTDNPYHYLRVDRTESGDRLILGGADHRMDIPLEGEKAFAALREYMGSILPGVPAEVVREWKGMIVEPGDGLAYMGTIQRPEVFYATGYSGNGLTYAVIAAQIFRDHVLGKKNDLHAIYAADRPYDAVAHAKAAGHYAAELLGGLSENS